MNSKTISYVGIGVASAALAVALVGPVSALPGQNKVDGGDIVNNSVTGKDVNEMKLGPTTKVGVLPSGKSMSGVFSAAGAKGGAGPNNGWISWTAQYPLLLKTAIDQANIIDTSETPDPVNCPGAGQAAPGYLCIYVDDEVEIEELYGYSYKTGIAGFAPVQDDDGAEPYAYGTWTVTAP